MKKLLFVFALLAALSAGVFLTRPTVQNVKADDKSVTICHWDEGNNAYKSPQSVSNDSIYKWDNGHDICKTGGHGLDPKDIIPSFVNGVCIFAGLNTDKVAWISNDCKQPKTRVCDDTKATNFGGTDGIFDPATETADNSLCQYVAAGTCPTACGQAASTVPDGKGGTIPCDATAACPITPTATPSATPTPTNGGGSTGGSDGQSDGLGCSSHDCSGNKVGGGQVLGASTGPTQAVLGASTMAGTGTFENTVMDIMLVAGMIVLSLGGLSYAKENK